MIRARFILDRVHDFGGGSDDSVYFHHRKIWVLVEEVPEGGSRVTLGAFSSRAKTFHAEFEELAEGLKTS